MTKTASRKTDSRKTAADIGPNGPAPPKVRPAEGTKAANAKGKKAAALPPAKNPAEPPGKAAAKRAASAKTGRLPPRKTFLVAATRLADDGTTVLQVYAAVTRSPAEALAALRAELGPDVAVELTGKLSNRMAKALGLKAGALHPI